MQAPSGPAQPAHSRSSRLLSASDVHRLFGVDRSTIYRMAGDGRLAAVKIGRQWRFPADQIAQMLQLAPEEADAASPVATAGPGVMIERATERLAEMATPMLDVLAKLLGVMMLVTDMAGQPLTPVSNPAPWFAQHWDDSATLTECVREWHQLAVDPDLAVRFQGGDLGFECARAFIRNGSMLIGMVLAGGVAPDGSDLPGLYRLDGEGRLRVLTVLPMMAAALSRAATVASPAVVAPRTRPTPQPTDRPEAVTNTRSVQ